MECFYRSERDEVVIQLAQLMRDEGAPGQSFLSNGILCGPLLDSDVEDTVNQNLVQTGDPFIIYNADIFRLAQKELASLALFENYRFGLPNLKENTLTIERNGDVREVKGQPFTRVRLDENRICLADTYVSRESTKQSNDKVARNMESAHRTSLAKGEAGRRLGLACTYLKRSRRAFMSSAAACKCFRDDAGK